ncbi:MAG TPA: hypothetical protein VNI77_10865 [Nitrososphaera sp.]|nr:hypothetical protein [Nitrososphaera sp.]
MLLGIVYSATDHGIDNSHDFSVTTRKSVNRALAKSAIDLASVEDRVGGPAETSFANNTRSGKSFLGFLPKPSWQRWEILFSTGYAGLIVLDKVDYVKLASENVPRAHQARIQ